MSIRQGFSGYYSHFGFRGLVAISTYRLFGQPKELKAHPPCIQNPVHLRVRTTDVSTYSEILLRKEYDFDLPFSPKTIIDAGANIGMASIYFAHRYPDAKIVAVEAEASNFAMLARNVQPYPAITPIHAALWRQDGEIAVREPDPSGGASGNWAFVTAEGPGIRVRAITVRTLMKAMQFETVDLAKIDIEGAEIEVFEKAEWANSVRCLMIELHDRFRPGCSDAVEAVVSQFSKLQRGETTLYLRTT